MLSVLHRPELVTPPLLAWLRPFVKYDVDGRGSTWLHCSGTTERLPFLLAEVAGAVMPGVTFSGVLLQSYAHGRAVTPCHTDAGGTGDGFILSIGATRTFRVHRVPGACDGSGAIWLECVNGTVIVMGEEFHAHHHHQLIASPSVTEEKLSLVFRTRPRGG